MKVYRLLKELIWLGPFVLLAMMALTLFRPWQTIPPLATGRVIIDGKGREAIMPEPFTGVIVGTYFGEFLWHTHAPEALLKIDGPRQRPKPGDRPGLPIRIYPQLVRNDALWDFPNDTETILAKDTGGVYLFGGSYFNEFGLTGIDFYPEFGSMLNKDGTLNKDEVIFTVARVLNRMLDQEEHAEPIIERYRRGYADLAAELRPDELAETERPYVLAVMCDGWDRVYSEFYFDYRIGLRDPTKGYMALGRESDAERILAMKPDVIVLFVGDSVEFLHDPRWRGMEAVQSRRVYSNAVMNRYEFDLDSQPLGSRWVAEIAYPDRLRPLVRDLTRNYYEESYGYHLSEEELDEMLLVDRNREAAGYEHYLRPDAGRSGRELP